MKIRWGRLVIGSIAAEFTLIALLVALVAIFGPNDPHAAQTFAEHLGRWVGPIGGALITFILSLWIGRRLSTAQVVHGVLLGCMLALIDVAILVASRTPFEWVFVVSNLVKIAAGYLGGITAARSSGAA